MKMEHLCLDSRGVRAPGDTNKSTIDVNGNWVVPTCYFGLDVPSEIGYDFRFRAELRDENGEVKATDVVHKVTRK